MADRKRPRDIETWMQQLEDEGRTNPERGPNDDTEQTRGHPGVTEDAAGGRSDNDEEDSDSEEEDSGSTYQLIFSEDVVSFSDNIIVSTSQLSISEHGESSSDFSSVSSSQLRTSDDEILIGHFNSRSINMKQSRISKLKNKFNLKVLMLNETRVTPENGDQRLGKISPGEFDVFHQPRVNQDGKSKKRTGGGVAILSSKELKGRRVQFEDRSFESFEYVAADLRHVKWTRPLQTVTVYRRPGGNDKDMRKFLEEFQKLLNKFSQHDSILITGDFNIWVNDKTNKHAKLFIQLLEANGFNQQVEGPTHKDGNTLDLVIIRNVHISLACVKKPRKKTKNRNQLSDHYAIIFIIRAS